MLKQKSRYGIIICLLSILHPIHGMIKRKYAHIRIDRSVTYKAKKMPRKKRSKRPPFRIFKRKLVRSKATQTPNGRICNISHLHAQTKRQSIIKERELETITLQVLLNIASNPESAKTLDQLEFGNNPKSPNIFS